VGVAKDIKLHRFNEGALPFFYIPSRQQYRPEYGVTFHVRTDGPLNTIFTEIRRAAADIDPGLPIFDEQPMTEYIAGSTYSVKIAATLLSILGGVGILLAGMGLYSVTAFSVTQRRTEIGIRIALGAQAADVLKMVLRDGLRFTLAGLVVGAIASAFLVRVAATSMSELQPAAPLVYLAAAAFTLALAAIALAIPGTRALRIDPMVALRTE
jgi:ABC-type antimicrobial peptide transport system permease subunit